MAEVSFEYLQHLVTVPTSVNGIESRFVVDSGIGLTLLKSELAESAGARATGALFTGRRMSGQSVTIPLGEVPTMTFAGSTFEQVEVGIFDMSSFPADLAGIGGFFSLAFFADHPLTVDYRRGVVILETRETVAARYAEGGPVSVDVQRDGPSVTMFMPLTIPGGRSISVEAVSSVPWARRSPSPSSEAPVSSAKRSPRISWSLPMSTLRRTTRTSCSSGSSTMASSATPSCGDTR